MISPNEGPIIDTAATQDPAAVEWVEPTSAESGRLTEEDIYKWREQGYCFVDNLLPICLLDKVKSDGNTTYFFLKA